MNKYLGSAYLHDDDSECWIRIITDTDEWDEPVNGWTYVIDWINGVAYFEHSDGRIYAER